MLEQVPEASVVVNGAGKPAKGSFIVRVAEKTVVSLLVCVPACLKTLKPCIRRFALSY